MINFIKDAIILDERMTKETGVSNIRMMVKTVVVRTQYHHLYEHVHVIGNNRSWDSNLRSSEFLHSYAPSFTYGDSTLQMPKTSGFGSIKP